MFLKGFVSGVDRFERHLFSSNSFTLPQDLLLQRMMGIEVIVEGGVDVVGPHQNGLSNSKLVATHATRIFTALCSYRLVDIIALLGETHPSPTVVKRTTAPKGPLQVRTFNFISLWRTHLSSQCFSDLKDWISLLSKFKGIWTKADQPIGPASLNTGPDGLHVPVVLLRNISRFNSVSKRAKITENFITAAMHLSYLRCTSLRDDLPDSAQALISE